jgi:hypothetical protein
VAKNLVSNAVNVIRNHQIGSPAAGFVPQGNACYPRSLGHFWLVPLS